MTVNLPLVSCLHHITQNVNRHYRWRRTKGLGKITPMKSNHLFFLLELLLSFLTKLSNTENVILHLISMVDQDAKFYSQQLVLIIL